VESRIGDQSDRAIYITDGCLITILLRGWILRGSAHLLHRVPAQIDIAGPDCRLFDADRADRTPGTAQTRLDIVLKPVWATLTLIPPQDGYGAFDASSSAT
jgi:hypothetical protein